MKNIKILTANEAVAYAVKLARVQVIAAYPITPQTECVENISEFIESGELLAELIRVESEHSALSAVIGASSCGVRTFTATSSQGLALMHEMLHWAAGTRLPIVMYVVNRALAAPWSLWCDHQDSISQRDTGWIQFYAENNQEIFDTILMSYKICEDKDIHLPAMICADGFTLSHAAAPVEIPSQKDVDEFLPPYNLALALDNIENPITYVPTCSPLRPDSDWYMEYKYMQNEAMLKAIKKIKKVCEEFNEKFGRFHGDLLEEYRCDDAKVVILSMGSFAAQAKDVVDSMRLEGFKVGAVKVRAFRPFPVSNLREIAKKVKAIAVIDRSFSFGHCGSLFMEVKSALYNMSDRPLIKGFVMGLGGRDIRSSDQRYAVEQTFKELEKGIVEKEIEWINLKV